MMELAKLPVCLATFPSAFEDLNLMELDLNKLVFKHPSSTFMFRVRGNSLVDKGIFEEDIAIVDRSCNIRSGDTVIGVVEGVFVIKSYLKKGKEHYLSSRDAEYKISFDEGIFGKVIYVLKDLRNVFTH